MNRHVNSLNPYANSEHLALSYARIFRDSQEAIMVTDRDSKIVNVNPAFVAITGYSEEEVVGRTPSLLKSGMQDALFYVDMWASIHRDGRWQGEIWNRRKNGEIYPEWLSISSVKDDQGELIHYVAMFSDITTRKNTLSKLRLHAQVFSNANEGIMITDNRLRILSVNRAFTAVTGYSEAEAIGQSPRMLQSGKQDPLFYVHMWERIHATGYWQGEIWNRRKNGDVYPEWLSISTLRDETGRITNYIGMFIDITERKQSEESLRYLAHFDKLTDLPNRTLLHKLVKKANAGTDADAPLQKMAVFFIDLDRFKTINDSLGHSIGDKLLQLVAQRFNMSVDKEDIIARFGGDEFILVQRNPRSAEDALAYANRLIANLKRPFSVDGHELYLNASIGISLSPEHGDSFETLVKHADLAMYEAKVQKIDCQLFNSGIRDTFQRKMTLENELRRAIDKDQLHIHYQPQVNASTGQTEGLEALLRWSHPTLGQVSPGEFIPIAEETGSIMDIGKWVFATVCAQLSQWKAAGLKVPVVAVNLSARQFMAPDLVPTIRSIVCHAPCSPEQLVLEITESSSMHDIESVLPILREFKSIGFRIAIDDFGKGYSALGYMKQFPIDILKIDKSFIRELTTDTKSAVLTKAIIDMAHGMELRVIAEGVETPEQLATLRTMNCDIVQGFLVDPALSPNVLESRYLIGS
ncbi:EAL domain-containing protein [Cohnella sp. LGH]|uniref:sensor domain-containing protein n=1 Tax=Cohnella sp. LGH TaxID=1619153 RepID=UPI001AD989E7|nr:EAL domain-containing protein [Cohnella sp. LGH]QTH43362.1 EAL domain-containing protein [Cohnella sp. LGH]